MQNLPETYWSLVIESGWIQSAVWEIDAQEKMAKVLSVSQASHWESEEDLIAAADSVLSSAASELPDETSEPSKTVFGVAASWVLGGQIKSEHIDKIRKLCASLSLEPSGFVVLPEAIAYWVKSNEGAPLNGIVVGIGSDNLEVSVFKLGNLVGNVSVARSVSIAEDVIEGLVRFKGADNLPSRILLFDGKEGQLEEARQSLVGIDWMSQEVREKINFLHIPKVEIVDPKDKVLAVALAGASEIGQADKVVFAGHTDSDMGNDSESQSPEIGSNIDETDIVPEEFGFVAGDIKSSVQPTQINDVSQESSNMPKFKLPNFRFPNLHLSIPRLPRIMLPKNGLMVGLTLIGVFLAAGFAAWFFLPKATVSIYVSPKKIDSTQNLTLGSEISSRGETTSVSGSKTVSVTGTKTVGDAAKGQVTIYNTGDTATASAGTKITDSSGLSFTLDNDVSASGSNDATSPVTTTASVTAVDIGAEYNLASGTTFSIDGFSKSNIAAKNDSSFSGGSSREITAVSAEDRKKAEEKLALELTDQGKTSIKEKISENDFLIEESVAATASARDFDQKVGDEASNVSLSMTMDIKGQVVPKSDLSKLALGYLKDKIPTGFVLRADQVTYEFTLVSGKKYRVKFTANLLPEINTDEIAKKLLGKKVIPAETILSEIPGFVRSEIKFIPRLGPLTTLPHLTKNISVELASEK